MRVALITSTRKPAHVPDFLCPSIEKSEDKKCLVKRGGGTRLRGRVGYSGHRLCCARLFAVTMQVQVVSRYRLMKYHWFIVQVCLIPNSMHTLSALRKEDRATRWGFFSSHRRRKLIIDKSLVCQFPLFLHAWTEGCASGSRRSRTRCQSHSPTQRVEEQEQEGEGGQTRHCGIWNLLDTKLIPESGDSNFDKTDCTA